MTDSECKEFRAELMRIFKTHYPDLNDPHLITQMAEISSLVATIAINLHEEKYHQE